MSNEVVASIEHGQTLTCDMQSVSATKQLKTAYAVGAQHERAHQRRVESLTCTGTDDTLL